MPAAAAYFPDKTPDRSDSTRHGPLCRLGAAMLAVVVTACLTLAPAGAATAAAGQYPTVAVVLGGGAARGLSHIGLLRALEEHGIPVDILVGASMGSIVAGLYAAGLSVDNLTYLATHLGLYQLFTPRFPPRGGLVDAEPFGQFLDHITGRARLEQMPIPFYSVVADLRTGETVALDRGPIGRAILASMAIPGVFPPVEVDGRLYVDGGLVSSVPVRAAREAGADFVIAVDVRRGVDEVVPGNVVANLQLALYVLLDKRTDEQVLEADVLVAPAVADSSYMEFDRAEYFIEEGYRAAMAAMDDIKEGLRRLDPTLALDAPRRQPGIAMDEFRRLVDEAAALATARGPRVPNLVPEVAISSVSAPLAGVTVYVPLGSTHPAWPVFAYYRLTAGPGLWRHALGAGVGHCRQLCAGIYGRVSTGGGLWSPGIMAAGTLRVGDWTGVGTAAWQAAWEWRPDDEDDAWRVQARVPAPSARAAAGNELMLQLGRDSQGLDGSADDALRGSAVWRHYWLDEPENALELIRGATHWYVGGGLGLTSDAGGTRLYPVAEAGLLFETRLFGLYTTQSRLSLTYEANAGVWFIRLSVGD